MKNIIKLILVMAIILNSGCASYLVMQNSRDGLIKANKTEDGVFVGVDILNLSVLKEQPLLQLSAGILDAFIIYAGYNFLQEGESNSGRNIIITGDKNDVTFTGDDNSVKLDVDYKE